MTMTTHSAKSQSKPLHLVYVEYDTNCLVYVIVTFRHTQTNLCLLEITQCPLGTHKAFPLKT